MPIFAQGSDPGSGERHAAVEVRVRHGLQYDHDDVGFRPGVSAILIGKRICAFETVFPHRRPQEGLYVYALNHAGGFCEALYDDVFIIGVDSFLATIPFELDP